MGVFPGILAYSIRKTGLFMASELGEHEDLTTKNYPIDSDLPPQ